MSIRAGGGVDSPSSSASPHDEEHKGDKDNVITPETVLGNVKVQNTIGSIPPPYAHTVDEIEICPPCNEKVTEDGILCEKCCTWFHQICSNLSSNEFEQLSLSREAWYCSVCTKKDDQCSSESGPTFATQEGSDPLSIDVSSVLDEPKSEPRPPTDTNNCPCGVKNRKDVWKNSS